MPNRAAARTEPADLAIDRAGHDRASASLGVDFWAVFASAPDAYLLLAPDAPRFTIVGANDARVRATMTPREDVLGRPLFEAFPDNPDDPEASGVRNLRASLEEVLRTRQPHRMALQQYDLRTPEGTFEERYWDPLNSPVLDADGNVVCIIHRVEDVTERVRTERRLRRAESEVAATAQQLTRATAAHAEESQARREVEAILARLRESEERYRLLADMIPQHIWTADAEGQLNYFSRRVYEYTGAAHDQLRGPQWVELVHPDDRERAAEQWRHSVETGEPYSVEYRVRGADGLYRWFLGQAAPRRDESGAITGWFGTLTDISEAKRLEAARERVLEVERKAGAEVTTILESITDAFYALDREWRFTYVNQRAEEILQRRREELVGRSIWEEFPDAVGSAFDRAFHRAMAEQATAQFEAFAPTAGIWADVRAYPSADGLSVFFRDITDRKRAEERVRESEESFRALANSIPQLAWMAAPSGWIFWYNERWYEYTGKSPREMEGWGWRSVHHPDHVDRVVARIRQAFETGTPWEDTFPLRSRAGEWRWFLSRAVPIRDAEGKIVRWFGTNTDVTAERETAAERERLFVREREAREQVTDILESITDAFFAVDTEWRFTYVNREAERLLQRPRADLVGHSVWDEFPAAIGATFEHEYRRAVAERTTAQFEEYFAPLEAWFEVRAYPSESGLSVFFRDVTARRRAQEQLRESEERYRLLADLIPQSIWATDATGYHQYFSQRWYDFTGATLEDTKGAGWSEYLHPDDRERTAARWQQSLRTGERYSIEYRFRKHTGEYCWFWGQAVPQRNEAGEVVQWIGTLTDISERKKHDEERERLLEREREARAMAERRREELEQVTESRARLMRGFSHDVKNPLGAADGFAALLEEGIGGELTDSQRQSVKRIRRSIQVSLRLINDLLELARAEAGQIALQLQRVDAAALAREVAEDFRGQINAAGLMLEIRAPEPLPAHSDPVRVRQILGNLLSNAVKYAPASRITVSASRTSDGGAPKPGAWAAIRVADTGPGIPADKHETIFREFTRLDPSAPHGAGVGLAISRRIACLLGGDVTVESEAGHGSTFTLWLPASGA